MLLKVVGIAGILFAALAFVNSHSVAADAPARTGARQDRGQTGLDLVLTLLPEAAQPGDRITLRARLTNPLPEPASPQVTLLLPAALSLDFRSVPAGTAYNVQTGVVSWQPFVAGGETIELALDLDVNAADLRQPDHLITAELFHAGVIAAAEAHLWIGVAPAASAAVTPTTVAVGQPAQLLATLSGPGPVTQRWDLGDGRHLDAADPTVIYPLAGDYHVTLTAVNPVGSATASALVHVVPEPVAAFVTASPTYQVGEAIQFHDLSGGQPPLHASWDFGDGTSSVERQPLHTYDAPGTYAVRLVISNDYGRSEQLLPVVVVAAAPAEFAIPASGVAGRPFDVTAITADPSAQIFWNMGDGTILQGAQPRHVYWSAGQYLVTVVAETAAGQVSGSQWVQVGAGALRMVLPVIMSNAAFGPGRPATAEAAEASELGLLEIPPGMTAEEQLLAYINEARRLNGLPAVTYQAELSAAARAHAADMAAGSHTSHIGTDGSNPAIRIAWAGYAGGYGGEATAWGMQYPIEPVRFWLASPGHRAILLSPLVTEVGLAYLQDLSSDNIWYWTAEFASPNLPRLDPALVPAQADAVAEVAPAIELLGPPQGSSFTLDPSNQLIFTWSWPVPLEPDQRFGVYLRAGGRTYRIGSVTRLVFGDQYQYKTLATAVPVRPGAAEWQARLESDPLGTVIEESGFWPLTFVAAGPLGAPSPPAAAGTPEATPVVPPPVTPPGDPYPPGD